MALRPDLLVLVPTRGRPGSVARLAAACRETGATAQIMLLTDHDDTAYDVPFKLPRTWGRYSMPRRHLNAKLNEGARIGLDYAAIAFLGDDAVPETPGWDKALLEEATRDGGGWAYTATGGRSDIPEHVTIDTRIVRKLGWFACPAMNHYWLDNAWADLGKATGRLRYNPDVMIRHDRGEPDATTALALENSEHDGNAYTEWTRHQRALDIATIRELWP